VSLLEVRDLTVAFPTDTDTVNAVRGMNFDVNPREVVAHRWGRLRHGVADGLRERCSRPDRRRQGADGIREPFLDHDG